MDTSDGPRRGGGYRGNNPPRGGRSNYYNEWQQMPYNGGGYGQGRGGRSQPLPPPPRGGYYDDGRGAGYYDNGRSGYNQGFRGGRGQQRGRGYFGGRGRNNSYQGGGRGRGPGQGGRGGSSVKGPPQPEPLPPDVELLAELEGHTKKVTALAVDVATVQLFTGSQDGTMRVWSCESGQCIHTDDVGGQVNSMLIEGGFLFVGLRMAAGIGRIRAWHLQTMAQYSLDGHTGEIYCLAAAGGMLFSGGQDQSIRVWKFDPAKNGFECSAVLLAPQGGHGFAVSCLVVSGQYMFSADFGGTIKVWDLGSGQCVQTLEKAHRGTTHPAIRGLLVWEGHLVSSSLDGLIKIWEPSPEAGTIINPTPVYSFPSDQQDGAPQRQQLGELNGVLALCGITDSQGRSVLMVSYNTDTALRLFEMPTFQDRGALATSSSVRALAGGPGGLLMAGDEQGKIRVWRWKPPA
ncbi:hypothetical protein N2152v2_006481 [Parachlorella kessleri]